MSIEYYTVETLTETENVATEKSGKKNSRNMSLEALLQTQIIQHGKPHSHLPSFP